MITKVEQQMEYEKELHDFIKKSFENEEEIKHYKFLVSYMIMIDKYLLKEHHKQDIIDVVALIQDPNFGVLYDMIKTNMETDKLLPNFVRDEMKSYFKQHIYL